MLLGFSKSLKDLQKKSNLDVRTPCRRRRLTSKHSSTLMSKLRKWLMKEERSPGTPVNVLDPAIKLFGTTIGVTGGGVSSSADAADAGEVITGSSHTTSRQDSPQCSQVGCLSFPPSPLSLVSFCSVVPVVATDKRCEIHTP